MIKIKVNQDKLRIDKYLNQELGYSRNQIQQLIATNDILVNGKEVKSSYLVQINDEIIIKQLLLKEFILKPEPIKLDIRYEDDDVIVLNKPKGMVVHPAPGHEQGTLVNALLNYTSNLSDINGEERPGIVHRLDKDTSGLMVIAKNNEAHLNLAEQLKNKVMVRKYMALVQGIVKPNQGKIMVPLGRDPKNRKRMAVVEEKGRPAVTYFWVKERFKEQSLVECKLETGRTHQIRVHLQYIGHPLVNDPLYGYRKVINNKGQLLQAQQLGFYQPRTQEYLEFKLPLALEIETVITNLRAKSNILEKN